MNKYLFLYAIGSLALLLPACSGDKEEPVIPDGDQVTVTISTEILTSRASVTTQFANGDKMNVYAKTYGAPNAPDLVKGIQATRQNGAWSISPEIKLSEGGKAFIYAVAPYKEAIEDLTAIPIDITQQQDVLYSGSYMPVTFTSNRAKLTMKHALSLAAYNISNYGYTGTGILQNLSITGDVVYIQGTMDIENGKITGTEKGSFAVDVNKQIIAGGWNTELPRTWSIPFSTQASVVKLKARIDGKEYEAILPEAEMRGGFQYIFHLVLTDYGLEFIPDQIVVISLDQDTDEMEELSGHGILRITHTAATFTLPTLTGDNVFGFVNWGDNTNAAYTIDATHTYSGTGEKQIIIENWNSTGFELNDLTGVEEIDVSEFP